MTVSRVKVLRSRSSCSIIRLSRYFLAVRRTFDYLPSYVGLKVLNFVKMPDKNDKSGENSGAEENDASAPLNPKEEQPAANGDPEAVVDDNRIELKKSVTLLSGISFIVGTVIGSGIFVSPTGILVTSKSIGLSLIVWLGCGVLAMLASLCYTELGTAVPKSGAEYAYLMKAFGPIPAFLFAWTGIVINRPAICAIVSLIFAEYVSKPFFPECKPPESVVKLLGLSCIGKA